MRAQASAMKGSQLTSQDFARILRSRWHVIVGTFTLAILCAVAYLLLATPQYEASTRLFVSTTADGNATQTNDGGLFAQRRVVSYTKLLTGGILAQRTIDKLGLDMSAKELEKKITTSAPADTVLIDVSVLDPSPTRARDIVNTLSDEFVTMAAALETPAGGLRPNAQVIVHQRADTPTTPASPRKKRTLAIVAALGVVLGVIAAVIRDHFDRRIRKTETVEKVTGVGVIGEIPVNPGSRARPLISFASDNSITAEAFRALRINLQSLEIRAGARTLVVTSPMPDEGRTTTALNLALALAEAEQNVVVVDGDLRYPSIAAYLDLDSQVGLTSVVTGTATLRDALQQTRFARVTALTSGPVPTNPTEVLESQAAEDVLAELSQAFDYVIVDSPPLLVTDAVILAGNAQGVLLLSRFGRTTRNQLKQAADALGRAAVPLLGAVVTMAIGKKRSATEARYYGAATKKAGPPERHASRRSRKK